MIRAIKRFLLGVLLLFVLASLAFFGFQRYQLHQSWPGGVDPALLPPAPGRVLRIAVINRPSEMLLKTVARLPAASELKLSIRKTTTPDERWQLLAAGEVDLVIANLSEFAEIQPRFDPGVVLAPLAENTASEAVVSSKAAHPTALVAYLPGGLSELLARSLNQSDLRAVASASPDEVVHWLQTGQVAAASLWEPYRTQALQAGGKILLDAQSKPSLEVLIASRKILAGDSSPRAERLDVVAFMTAWYQLIDQLEQDPALARKAIGSENEDPVKGTPDMTAERVESCLRGLKFLGLNDAQSRLEMLRDRILAELQSDSTFWSLAGAPNQRGANFAKAVDLSLLGAMAPALNAPVPTHTETPNLRNLPPITRTPEPELATPVPTSTPSSSPDRVPVDPFSPRESNAAATPDPAATPDDSATVDPDAGGATPVPAESPSGE